MHNNIQLEHLSVTLDVGVTLLDTAGQTLFESSVHATLSNFLQTLYHKLDCEEKCRVAFLYACYQARRFGGRYIFYAPSGLVYCAAPLLDEKGKMLSGVLVGPFLLTDYDDFIYYDVSSRVKLKKNDIDVLLQGIRSVPCITPKRAHALNEHIRYVAAAFFSQTDINEVVSVQTDMFSTVYPIEKEDELLSAISKGDIHTADTVLAEITKQMMFHHGGNIEVLRSRVVELTVLLSRAALKGGANIDAILGLNYGYLREIDGFSTIEDIVLWLQTTMRQFTQHVFDFSGGKHTDIIYKAVDYIKRNYAAKLTLKELADNLFISRQYFNRIFKESTGQTPGSYITFVRIEESKKLLRNSSVNIVDIPEMVGFENQSYFTKVFKSETGFTPGQYRRENLI